MVDAVDTDRREPDRGRDVVAKDGRRRIATGGVDQLAGDDLMAVKGQTVGVVRPRLAGVA